MTDRKKALQDLLAKVEEGVKYETMGHTQMCQRAFPKPKDFDGSREAYAKSDAQMAILAWRNGSLNAAKALHDAVLPGRDWILTNQASHADEPEGPMAAIHNGEDDPFEGSGDDPARAWLIAILRALIATEDGV